MTRQGNTTDDKHGARAVATNDATADAGKARRARLRTLIDSRAPNAPDAIVSAASDPEPLVRNEAAYQLAKTHHPKALEILGRLSKDPSPVVRIAVVEALASTGSDAARRILLGFAVDDPFEDVRRTAVYALADIPGPDAEHALDRLAHDPVPLIRDRASEFLSQRRPH
jgi:HEAT repeat protein